MAKWMQQAFNPAHKGRLHRALGVPAGTKIPLSKLKSAQRKGGKLARMANPVLTARRLRTKR